MPTAAGILLVVVALALMFRWGMRTGRLRRLHGRPPGAMRWLLDGVTIAYVAAGGWMVSYFARDLFPVTAARVPLGLLASVGSYVAGFLVEPAVSGWRERRAGDGTSRDAG